MHAWIKDDRIVTILPSEEDPETMGQIYNLSYHDSETLVELASMRKHAQRVENDFHRRLAAKLRKEQGQLFANCNSDTWVLPGGTLCCQNHTNGCPTKA